MKITKVEPHGTEKSTLAKKLSRILDLPLLPEIAREALERSGVDWLRLTQEEVAYAAWQAALYESLRTLHRRTPEFVADRSLLDVVAYTETYLGAAWVGKMFPDWWKDFEEIGYDRLVYCCRPYRQPDETWERLKTTFDLLLEIVQARGVSVVWLDNEGTGCV